MFDLSSIGIAYGSLLMLGLLITLLLTGMQLAFVTALVALIFTVGWFGIDAMPLITSRMYSFVNSYVFLAVPMFVLMAALLDRSGIAIDLFDAMKKFARRLRGGVAVQTLVVAVILASMSGVIGGETVLLGILALPQMLRLGYNQNLAIGTICASGSLGTMIPPSIVLIFYGLITETSIHALFTAAFLPGFLLAACYITYILIRTNLNPEQAPLPEPSPDDMTPAEKRRFGVTLIALVVGGISLLLAVRGVFFQAFSDMHDVRLAYWGAIGVSAAVFAVCAGYALGVVGIETSAEAWRRGKGLVAPLGVVAVVLGSIYLGITGITEAAGMGSVAVLILIILRGEFSFNLLREASMRTFKSTGTIIWVTLGATALAGSYTIAGGPTYVANLIVGYDLPTMGVLLVMMVIFLFLGAFMDWTGIVLLVMPVFLPIVLKLPMDELGLTGGLDSQSLVRVWFGILFCVNMQVSFLSPPFGPAAFYLKSVAPPHISLPDIFRGFLPFIAIQILILALILCVPEITTVFL